MKNLFYYLCFIAMILLVFFIFVFISIYREREETERVIAKNNELKLENKQLKRDIKILQMEVDDKDD